MTTTYEPQRLSSLDCRTRGNESWITAQHAVLAAERAQGRSTLLPMACGHTEWFDAAFSPARLRAISQELCVVCMLLVALEGGI
jgi:hypothetical protein